MGPGERFKQAVIRLITSWGDDIQILEEKPVGYRFVDMPRVIDILLKSGEKYLGIEAKVQTTRGGTAYQKLSYALEDIKISPIPTIIVFADVTGKGIKFDMKSKLIVSGLGIEVTFNDNEKEPDKADVIDSVGNTSGLFKQRVYIELGLDWFKLYD